MSASSYSPTRVLIVEDQGLFRDMLYRALSSQPELCEVVGAVDSGQSAIEHARELKPDVVVMDVGLGSGINGIQAGAIIRKENPDVGILVLTMSEETEHVANVLSGDTKGWSYLLKRSVNDLSALIMAVNGTAKGLTIVDPAIMGALKIQGKNGVDELTPKETDVLSLMAQGHSNLGIAEKLALSTKSVERYINSMYQKLQVTSGENIHPRVKVVVQYILSGERTA